ncbi:MAG: RNA polymerase sigma factor [Acidimicrobiia bacterium]
MLDPSEVKELVVSANAGHQESWNRLVDTYAGLVWSVVRSHQLFGPEAADISQTVWLRCVEHLGRIREPEHLAAWLATTARHECFRVLRKNGRNVVVDEVPEIDADEYEESPGLSAAIAADDRRAVAAALELVPERCRQLLRMLVTDPPLSYDEIGGVLDMPKGSIGPTRARCLAHLRRALEDAGDV